MGGWVGDCLAVWRWKEDMRLLGDATDTMGGVARQAHPRPPTGGALSTHSHAQPHHTVLAGAQEKFAVAWGSTERGALSQVQVLPLSMTSSPPPPQQATLLDAHDTDQTACTTEFCPAKGWEAWLATGTYQLVKQEGAPDTRTGRLLLHRLEGKVRRRKDHHTTAFPTHPIQHTHMQKLVHTQTLDVGAGVLDCKWRPAAAGATALPPTLACALSTGEIVTYHLQHTDEDDSGTSPAQLVLASKSSSTDAEGEEENKDAAAFMSLALDWSRDSSTTSSSSSSSPRIVSSQNKGRVAVHQYDTETSALSPLIEWEAHALYGTPIEVWTATFAAGGNGGDVVYSGGDDSTLKGWDLRVGTSSPIWSDGKTHEAGVTAVQASPWAGEEHVFVSGSYDGQVRVWDARTLRPVCVHACDVEGGVWRLKWHPRDRKQLAVAAMHGGAWVVRFEDKEEEEEGKTQALAKKTCHHARHASMVYGMDWWHGGGREEDEEDVLATCSFYDHALHLWQPPGAGQDV